MHQQILSYFTMSHKFAGFSIWYILYIKISFIPNAIPETRHQDASSLGDSEYYAVHLLLRNHTFKCKSKGLLWCFITNNYLLYNKQHPWRVKGNMQTDFHSKGRIRRAKTYSHTDRGWGEFPETGRPEIAHSSIRPEEMLLLFLKVCTNREEWKKSLQFIAIHYPNLYICCFQWVIRHKPESSEALHT